MWSIIFGILGLILLVPIAIALVALIVTSLFGGYVAAVIYFCWKMILVATAVYPIVKIVKHFTKKN